MERQVQAPNFCVFPLVHPSPKQRAEWFCVNEKGCKAKRSQDLKPVHEPEHSPSMKTNLMKVFTSNSATASLPGGSWDAPLTPITVHLVLCVRSAFATELQASGFVHSVFIALNEESGQTLHIQYSCKGEC